MVKPGGADFSDGVGSERLGQVDAGDAGAAGLAAGGDGEGHPAMLRRFIGEVNWEAGGQTK